MKKNILVLIVLLSTYIFGSYSEIKLKNYIIKPNYIKKITRNKYIFNFEIKYNLNQIGFEHDIKLMKDEQILENTVENIIGQAYSNNKNASIELYVPKNYENIEFNGIGIVERNSKKIEKVIKIK